MGAADVAAVVDTLDRAGTAHGEVVVLGSCTGIPNSSIFTTQE